MATKKKYILTKESIDHLGTKLFRIKALAAFGNVKKGELGGFIQNNKHLLGVLGEQDIYEMENKIEKALFLVQELKASFQKDVVEKIEKMLDTPCFPLEKSRTGCIEERLIVELLMEQCGDDQGNIDNICISTYEEACEYLHKKGVIKKLNDRMYKLDMKYFSGAEGECKECSEENDFVKSQKELIDAYNKDNKNRGKPRPPTDVPRKSMASPSDAVCRESKLTSTSREAKSTTEEGKA